MSDTSNHYEVLGVSRDATLDEITSAYRMLVRRYADQKPQFDAVTAAYMILADALSREKYDTDLGLPAAGSAKAGEVTTREAPATLKCASCGATNAAGNRFCGECGFVLSSASGEGGRPRLGIGRLVLPAPAPSYTIEHGELVIGRGAGCTVQLGDPYASTRHARLVCEMGIFTLEDLGSTNGTRLNGQRLEPRKPTKIDNGDLIGVGQTDLRFEVQ